MLDAAIERPPLQRTRGRAEVMLDTRRGRVRLAHLHQSGSAKAMMPRTHARDPEIVFLNTSGGVTGGDALSYSLSIGDGAAATASTQTAERAYRSVDGAAGRIDVDLSIGKGARLHWLPQELILFDGSATERRTRINMAGDAELIFVETVTLGRIAMGETLTQVHLKDDRRITRDGKPVVWEPLVVDETLLSARAGLNDCRSIATVMCVAPWAENALTKIPTDAFDGVALAASAWDGKLIVRAMAVDAQPLRKAIAGVLGCLRDADLPRVWQI